jgi:arylsulfatase
MIIYIVGDNGASSEGGMDGTLNEVKSLNGFPTPLEENLKHIDTIGGPDGEPHYPTAWAWSGNAPFQWVKQVASHFGGTRNPMIISWPARIKDVGGIRTQFTHLIDVVPTILDAAGIPAPKSVDGVVQKPMDGVSFLSTFASAQATPHRKRQYFEVFSNRAIYDNGWIASAQHTFPWRQDYAPGNWDNDRWELYNIDADFSQANDLAGQNPKKLAELKALFDAEAKKNHVYPLDDRGTERVFIQKPSAGGSDPKRTHFTYYTGAVRLAETAAANTKNKSHTITADIVMPEQGGEGVIVAEGGSSAGFALYVQDGKLVYHFNWFEESRYVITSSEPMPAGKSTVRFEFAYDGGGMGKGGKGTLFINGKKVGEGRIEKTVPGRFGIDTFGVGIDTGSPVSNTYKPPFVFTGRIEKVEIDLVPGKLSAGTEQDIDKAHAAFAKGTE